MARKQEIEFLATGEITWGNRSGTKEQRKHVQKGDRLQVRVVQQGDNYELWDGNWSVLMPAKNIKIVKHFPISFDVYKGDTMIGSQSVRSKKEKREVLKALRKVYGKVELRDQAQPQALDSMYRGKEPFTREQIAFAAECILVGALDMIESGLPDSIEWTERKGPMAKADTDPTTLATYERGALEAAGEAFSILYAQLTGDGMGCYDALYEADHFDEAVGNMMAAAWQDKGEAVKAAIKQRQGRYEIKDVIPHYPDTRHCANAFADVVLDQLGKGIGTDPLTP